MHLKNTLTLCFSFFLETIHCEYLIVGGIKYQISSILERKNFLFKTENISVIKNDTQQHFFQGSLAVAFENAPKKALIYCSFF